MSKQQTVTVDLVEFIEALERTTKMRRAPAGSRSKGLREGAFIPAVGGFRVEMPGGAHFVWAKQGKLTEEVVFNPDQFAPIVKVLKTYLKKTGTLDICATKDAISIRCGTSKMTVKRK